MYKFFRLTKTLSDCFLSDPYSYSQIMYKSYDFLESMPGF